MNIPRETSITIQQNIWKNLNYLYRIETFCTCKLLDLPWFVPKLPKDCMLGDGICLSSVNSDIVFTGNTKMRRVWQCLRRMRTLINFTEHVTYRKVLVVRWGMQEWVEPCQVLSQFHQCCLGPGFYNWYWHFCITWDAAKDDTWNPSYNNNNKKNKHTNIKTWFWEEASAKHTWNWETHGGYVCWPLYSSGSPHPELQKSEWWSITSCPWQLKLRVTVLRTSLDGATAYTQVHSSTMLIKYQHCFMSIKNFKVVSLKKTT